MCVECGFSPKLNLILKEMHDCRYAYKAKYFIKMTNNFLTQIFICNICVKKKKKITGHHLYWYLITHEHHTLYYLYSGTEYYWKYYVIFWKWHFFLWHHLFAFLNLSILLKWNSFFDVTYIIHSSIHVLWKGVLSWRLMIFYQLFKKEIRGTQHQIV